MFIFFIKHQQRFCLEHLERIKDTKKPYAIKYPEANSTFICLAAASVRYRKSTESIGGYLKSFVPFTSQFKARIEVARQISAAHKCLNEVMKLIRVAAREKKAKLTSDNVLPKVHPPLFKAPVKPSSPQATCPLSFWPTFKF